MSLDDPQANRVAQRDVETALMNWGRFQPMAPVWRYSAKDCLKPHKVPAVDAFRKAVDEADQAAAKQP